MDLSKLSLSDKIIGGTAIVLIIDLLFLPWHNVDVPFLGNYSRTAVQSPDSFWGILALLLTIAVVVVVALRVFSPDTKLPELPVSWDMATFYATAAVGVLLLLKLIVNTDYLGFGAWLGIVLAAGMVYGGFLKFQEDRKATPAV